MTRVGALAIASALCLFVACSSPAPPPPKALGTPRHVDELTGIWRTVKQNTLEMRLKGTYVLITPVTETAAMAGDFTLDQGRMTFFNDKACGSSQGTYRIQVAAKDRLLLDEADDACAPRRTALTSDPFVYAQPDFS
jgi:hypothetical protein